MTILKALKNLIAKGGGSTKAGTIAEAINDMPISGGPLVVTITGNDDDGYVADKTFDEIAEAFPNVIAFVPAPTDGVGVVYNAAEYETDNYYAFSNTEFGIGELYQTRFSIKSDNIIDFYEYEYPSQK